VASQQSVTITQGTGSSGNSVNVALAVNVNNQGSATAGSGTAAAAGQTGSNTFTAIVSSSATAVSSTSASPAGSGTPATSGAIPSTSPAASSTVLASPTAAASPSAAPSPAATPPAGVLISASNNATAASGSAQAIGVIADTHVIGDQAVVIHIPANTSNQSAQITLSATLTNTGIALSQTGNVAATGLQGSISLAAGAAPNGPAAATAAASMPSGTSVDLRDTNYALASSGDAMAIGVKSTTVVQGLQRVTVIIDDNSSGNRIQVVFLVTVDNEGSASALSGGASATGQKGNLQIGLPGAGGAGVSGSVLSSGTSVSGAASAIGVDATTFVNAVQLIDVEVGNGSSNNQVDAQFLVNVTNHGTAQAYSGAANAAGLAGNVSAGAPAGPSLTWSAAQGSVRITNTANGKSGNADSRGLQATSNLDENQNVDTKLLAGPSLSISQSDRVVNLGLARSVTGDVVVVAQLIPPPQPPADQPSGEGSSPAPASHAAQTYASLPIIAVPTGTASSSAGDSPSSGAVAGASVADPEPAADGQAQTGREPPARAVRSAGPQVPTPASGQTGNSAPAPAQAAQPWLDWFLLAPTHTSAGDAPGSVAAQQPQQPGGRMGWLAGALPAIAGLLWWGARRRA